MKQKPTAYKRILDSAVKVFAQKGYDGANVQEIAARAKVNKAMLFYYFKSKENLYLSLLKEAQKEISEKVLYIAKTNTDSERKIKELAVVFTKTIFDKQDLLRVALREIIEYKFKIHFTASDHAKKAIDFVKSIVNDGIKSGKFKAVNPEMTALTFFGIIKTLFTQQFVTGKKFSQKEIADFTSNLVLNGIRK